MPDRNCSTCLKDFFTHNYSHICPTCLDIRTAERRERKKADGHLTERDKQIIEMISKGLQNKEIASQLHLTEGTVKCYVSRIFDKLGFHNRTELAAWHLTPKPIAVPQEPLS